jgi:pyruvate dehydrogenase E2 component (dihydrolipoamide acetyltransferase)
MPKLTDSMEHGLVLQWLIDEGQPVAVGAELVEIETDKATMTYESELEGVLSIAVPAGTTVPVGEVIARVGGRLGDGDASAGATAIEPDAIDMTPNREATANTHSVRVERAGDTGEARIALASSGRQSTMVVNAGAGAAASPLALATPVAHRLAAIHGIELDAVRGTGPRGRITKSDVRTAAGLAESKSASVGRTGQLQSTTPPATPTPQTASPGLAPSLQVNGTQELTRTQQLIARRMSESKATIPHFQVQTEVLMDRALELRAEMMDLSDAAPSINDLIVRASALALREHPRANSSYEQDRFVLHDQINIGVAVATHDALFVPTVFAADRKTLIEIAADTRRLAKRVHSSAITPQELSGATFTVSNLGMYGMTAITPVVNPPQAAILGVGTIRDGLARDSGSGEIIDRAFMTMTLSCDHRILYGADAARFLAEIRRLLEQPVNLFLEASIGWGTRT